MKHEHTAKDYTTFKHISIEYTTFEQLAIDYNTFEHTAQLTHNITQHHIKSHKTTIEHNILYVWCIVYICVAMVYYMYLYGAGICIMCICMGMVALYL